MKQKINIKSMLYTASLNHIPWHMLQVYLYSCPPMIQWRDITQTWQEKSGSYSYMYGHRLTSIFLPNPSAKSTIWAYRERGRYKLNDNRNSDTKVTDWLTDWPWIWVCVCSVHPSATHAWYPPDLLGEKRVRCGGSTRWYSNLAKVTHTYTYTYTYL